MKKFNLMTEKQMAKTDGGLLGVLLFGGLGALTVGGIGTGLGVHIDKLKKSGQK